MSSHTLSQVCRTQRSAFFAQGDSRNRDNGVYTSAMNLRHAKSATNGSDVSRRHSPQSRWTAQIRTRPLSDRSRLPEAATRSILARGEIPAGAAMPDVTLPEDGLIAVVKRDCPTCVLAAPVLGELARRAPLTVYTQDDPAF